MASMIFALLKTDQELLANVPPDQELLANVPPDQDPPAPMLYDPEIHHRHRTGHYSSLKPGTQPRRIIQLPKRP